MDLISFPCKLRQLESKAESMNLHLAIQAISFQVLVEPTIFKEFGAACHLVLAVVGAPATTAVVAATAVATAKSTVVAVAALLVLLVATLLVTQSTKSVLAVSAKVAGVAAKALLVRLLLVQTLSALARSALSG
jgi:hypothetical protein